MARINLKQIAEYVAISARDNASAEAELGTVEWEKLFEDTARSIVDGLTGSEFQSWAPRRLTSTEADKVLSIVLGRKSNPMPTKKLKDHVHKLGKKTTSGAIPCGECGRYKVKPKPKVAVVAVAVADSAKPVKGKGACKPPVGVTKEKAPPGYEACMVTAKKLGSIDEAHKVYDLVWPALSKEDQEVFLILPLNANLTLKSAPRELFRGGRTSIGSVDHTVILGEVLRTNAVAWIAVHNHPSSGDPSPSDADKETTKTFRESSKVVGLTFLDHVIVARTGAYSFHEDKVFKTSSA